MHIYYIFTYVYVYVYIYIYIHIYTNIYIYVYIYIYTYVLQCVAVSCSVMQCLLVSSSVLQCVAVCATSTLHCIPPSQRFLKENTFFQKEHIFLSPTTMRDIYTTFHPSVPAFFEREHIFLSPTTAQRRRMWRPTPTHIGLFFLMKKISLFEDNVCLCNLQQRSDVAYGGPHPH